MSASATIELAPISEGSTRQGPDISVSPDGTAHVEAAPDHKVQGKGKTALIVVTIAGVTMISSLLSGLVTISLPEMAKSLDIPSGLLFWYDSQWLTALSDVC